MKRIFPRSRDGFSLTEILISLSVVALLSAVLVTYNHTSEQQVVLIKEQAKIIGTVLRAKSLAIQANTEGGAVCGYGVHFSANGEFVLFKELCAGADNRYSDVSERIETYQLQQSLHFTGPLAISDIVFLPPDPTVILTPPASEAAVRIATSDDLYSVAVNLNDAGQVSTD